MKTAIIRKLLFLICLLLGTASGFAGLVWVNTDTHIYHYPGQRWYEHTKHGKLIDEADAIAEGDRPTHNGQ
jgi:hypothetical protein